MRETMRKVIFAAAVLCMTTLLPAGRAISSEYELSMATAGPSGTFFPLGGAISGVINNHFDKANITVEATGGSVNNAHLMGGKEVELAIMQNDIAYYATNGMEIFKDRKYTNLRAICRIYPDTVHVIAKGNDSISSFEDFRGKKVSVGSPGSGSEVTLRQILGCAGLTYEDFNPLFLSFSETAEHFKDGHIDAFLINAGVPASLILDLGTLNKLALIPVDGKIRENLLKDYPFYTTVEIPANTYKNQTEVFQTVAVQALLIAEEEVPEEAVYGITKAIFEHLEDIAAANNAAKGMSLDTALDGVGIPLHPGAEKYYRETGLIK